MLLRRRADRAATVSARVPVAERFRAGDPDAVRSVFREYGRLVFSVALRALGDRDLAEEATQETFVRAWKAAAGFDVARDFAPWLATIVRRVAIDIHRREARLTAIRLDGLPTHHPSVVTLPSGVDNWFETWEVRAAVIALPRPEAEVVALHHLHGLTHSQIANRMGIPIGTVKSRMHSAHRHLAARLGHLRNDAS